MTGQCFIPLARRESKKFFAQGKKLDYRKVKSM